MIAAIAVVLPLSLYSVSVLDSVESTDPVIDSTPTHTSLNIKSTHGSLDIESIPARNTIVEESTQTTNNLVDKYYIGTDEISTEESTQTTNNLVDKYYVGTDEISTEESTQTHTSLGESIPIPDSMIKEDQEKHVENIVLLTIYQYDGEDLSSIDTLDYGEHYSFVLSDDLDEILLHPNYDVIGTHPTSINNADIPVDVIIETLNEDGEIWINYTYENPATNTIEDKKSLLILHEGYVFAAGYYNP